MKKMKYRFKIGKFTKNLKFLHKLKYIKLMFHKAILIFVCVNNLLFLTKHVYFTRRTQKVSHYYFSMHNMHISLSFFFLICTSLFCAYTLRSTESILEYWNTVVLEMRKLSYVVPFLPDFSKSKISLFFHVV